MSEKRKHKLLKYVDVMSTRLYKKNFTHNTILAWRISDYEELSSGIMYFHLYESDNLRCVFRLFKHKETLHLSLSSANILKDVPAEFSIIDEENCESITAQAEQINDSILTAKFSYEQFLLPDSNFLSNGMLTITFKYLSDYCVAYRNASNEKGNFLHHWDDLCYDLKSMYLDSLFPDFFIHLKKCIFKSHRIVLSARSKFFSDLLKSDKEVKDHRLSDDVVPGILHQVLLYMYSGELLDMDEDCMMEVYKLASMLEVSSLCSRCLDYFRKKMDLNNYMKLCEFAAKFNLKEMKNAIIHTAKKEFPHINIFDIFKEIEKKKDQKLYFLEVKKTSDKDRMMNFCR